MGQNNKSKQSNQAVKVTEQENQRPQGVLHQETMSMLISQAAGNETVYKPTERQFDKFLELREKAMDYAHKENTIVSPQYKFDTWINILVLILLCIVASLIIIFKGEYTSEVLSAVLGAFGGFGYSKTGLGSSKKKQEIQE